MSQNTERIKTLNDQFRTSLSGGTVVWTQGIDSLPEPTRHTIVDRVRQFDKFSADNDPHGEHDFGSFDIDGDRIFWKIDYYNQTKDAGSEDPANPDITARVLTIMLAEEY